MKRVFLAILILPGFGIRSVQADSVHAYQIESAERCDQVQRHMQYIVGDRSTGITSYVLPDGQILFEQYDQAELVAYGRLGPEEIFQGTILDAWQYIDQVLESQDLAKWLGPDEDVCPD